MCEPATLSFIQDIIEKLVDEDKMFTAFDVSLAAKKKARQAGELVERHRHMKNAIHQEMDRYLSNGLYERQLMDVGSNLRAFIYYPEGQDPTQYTPLKRFDTQPTTTPTAMTTSTNSTDDDDDDDARSDTRGDGSPDSRGTINVPTYLLRAAGIEPSDEVHVAATTDNDESVLIITKNRPTDIDPLVTYKVDPNGAVRISKGQLNAGGLYGKKYEYDGSTNKVVVKVKE